MPRVKSQKTASDQFSPTENCPAIRHLEREILSGKHWYLALLEAIGIWDTPEETREGRTYRYLIDGEAFDWLLLAERLCQTVDILLPREEKTALLFYGEPPIDLTDKEFKEIIGAAKYHQHLNYFYGVTVEEALIVAVEEEVRKERWASGYYKERDNSGEAYRRIYGSAKAILLRRFRKERNYTQLKSISLTELKEFTYWLFKHRLKQCDKAKVASDTKKALDWLKNKGYSRHIGRCDFEPEFIIPSPSEMNR